MTEDSNRALPQTGFATEDFTVLLLEQGPERARVEPAELQRLLNAHLGWMLALAGGGELLTAGALIDPSPVSPVTGLGFSHLEPDSLSARAALDPAVQAGVESFRVVTYRLPKGSILFPAEAEGNKARSRRLYEEVFGKGNLEAADEILDPDALNHGPGAPPTRGSEQIKRQAMLLRTAIPDLRTTLEDQFAEGDRVASRWAGSGTHTGTATFPTGPLLPTNNPISFQEIRIDRHADGRIVESWFIPDRLTFWMQLGLIPSPRR